MNRDKHIVACDHIKVGFTYDRNLLHAVIAALPKFVHKHAIVYKMYATLKLYYLHQQTLLNQILGILQEHKSSKELAVTMKKYIGQLNGKNFGWLKDIESELKAHMVPDMDMKKTYAKYHEKGFEIVGVSLDQSKDKLTDFVKENDMPWPQHFDGLGWKNEFAVMYGIQGIPAMWLVDKDGNLVDMKARSGLDAKVEKLLAE